MNPIDRTRIAKNLRHDVPAGLVVFLVALPLCLGIALASGAPLMSGIVTGMVAGIVVSWFTGCQLSVSGPAAGLTVIVASAITKLGSFEVFLTAVCLSGLLQIAFSLLKTGSLSGFVPNSVIKGMLAAIGVIIILKQVPHGLGRDTDYEGDLSFWQFLDGQNTFSEIMMALQAFNPVILGVTASCLAVIIFWPNLQTFFPRLKPIPSALGAVLTGVIIHEGLSWLFPSLRIETTHMVSLPNSAGLLEQMQNPVLSAITNPAVWTVALTLALVGSIESLLSVEATDRMDPFHRTSDPDRELLAQGIGNFVCGLLGGIPMTAVIVRSTANVYAGGRTHFSSFVHGVCLLVAVVALSPLLNRIPLGALAAILFAVGYKLTSPKLFSDITRKGLDQLVPFLVTFFTIIFTDLLTGVGAGIAVGLVMVVISNHYGAVTVVSQGTDYLVRFTKDVSFSNKVFLKSALAKIPDGSYVTIDGGRAFFIDNDIYDVIATFKESAVHRNISVETREIHGKRFSIRNRRRQKVNAATQAIAS